MPLCAPTSRVRNLVTTVVSGTRRADFAVQRFEPHHNQPGRLPTGELYQALLVYFFIQFVSVEDDTFDY